VGVKAIALEGDEQGAGVRSRVSVATALKLELGGGAHAERFRDPRARPEVTRPPAPSRWSARRRLLFRPITWYVSCPCREEDGVSRRASSGAGDGPAAVELAVMRPGTHSDFHVVEDLLRILGARLSDVRIAMSAGARTPCPSGAFAAVAIAAAPIPRMSRPG